MQIAKVRYLALAADYDGTLAAEGRVRARTLAAVERLRESGRRAILVTGRELEDLKSVFPRLDIFDRVVPKTARSSIAPSPARKCRSPRRRRSSCSWSRSARRCRNERG